MQRSTDMQSSSDMSKPAGALAGVRVIDLSRVLAGPLCTQMLADHGADVIKIESPQGDETRTLGPPFTENGEAAYFTSVNRGKRALALDLAHPEGQSTLLRLLADADVLVENFLPGTMARWGLDCDKLLAQFPRLIYCSISGFGADGPLGGLPGYDAVVQAMCGLMSINGEKAAGPTRIGVPLVDHLTGYTALSGILMALYARERTGKGQQVEATLFDSALSLLVPHASNWMYSGRTPQLLGSAHPNIAPYDKFACRDGEFFLGILNERQFARFCETVDRTDLLRDERFTTNSHRLENSAALRSEIEHVCMPLARDELCQRLMRVGVPAGPVNTVPEALQQAHALHRDMVVTDGAYKGIGPAVRLFGTPASQGGPPPAYGQHSDEVLAGIGMSDSRIAELRQAGVIPKGPGTRRTD